MKSFENPTKKPSFASTDAKASVDKKATDGKEEKMPKSEIVCAWCQKLLGSKEGDGKISHGICDSCYEKEMDKLEATDPRKETNQKKTLKKT